MSTLRDDLTPLPVPERRELSPVIQHKHRTGSALDAHEIEEHSRWLRHAVHRADILQENARRLNVSTGAEVALRTLHAQRWGLCAVSEDPAQRQAQIADTIRRLSA